MSIIRGLMGHATEIDTAELEQELENLLVPEEGIEHAYKLVRDQVVFTSKRLILIDKQGLTGKKKEYLSVPYASITKYAKETAGRFDMDAEVKVWVRGDPTPINLEFRKDDSVHDVYRILSAATL